MTVSRSRSPGDSDSQRCSFSRSTVCTTSSPRSRSAAIVGTTSRLVSQRPKRSTSSSTSARARTASASRTLRPRATARCRSSMSYSATPGTSRAVGSTSRGTAMSIITSGRPGRSAMVSSRSSRSTITCGRRGRADHDVGLGQLGGQVLEADGRAAEALGQADRAVVVAVGHEHGLHAAGAQGARGQLAGLAGADDQHPLGGQVAELARGQRHRDRRTPTRGRARRRSRCARACRRPSASRNRRLLIGPVAPSTSASS